MSAKKPVNTESWNADFAVLMESRLGSLYRRMMLRRSRFSELLADKEKRIIDIGCGYGAGLAYFRSQGYRNLAAIEPDAQLTRDIPASMSVELRHCRAEKIAFPDRSFDAVFVYGILHHLSGFDAYWAACDEIDRILKPGGFVFIIEPGRYWVILLLEPIFKALGLFSRTFKAYGRTMDEERTEQHFFLKNHGKVREYLLKKGFRVRVDDYLVYTWLFTIQKPAEKG
ncbi:MAG: methyltransferase domain-containing protein [Elusimicrobia bacterium]|nr:methyltransferase domain-containing protein [Elusimicrobiota bacterium]